MLWLVVAILSYLFFALVSIVDRSLLRRSIKDPRVYTFYVGVLGIFSLFLIPLGFFIPAFPQILLALFAGAVVLLTLFVLFCGLKRFEASRFVPAWGGFLPFFMLGLSYVFSGKQLFGPKEAIAFLILVLGSVLITIEREKPFSFAGLGFAALTAFLFALSFLLMKLVYMELPFWPGFIWIRIGSFLAALVFLFSPGIRMTIKRRNQMEKKTALVFFLNQGMGAIAISLQSFSLALVPLAFLAFIGAVQGIEYVFILFLAVLFSLKFPQVIKEEISGITLVQKAFAIALIGIGLIVLAI
ncbi:MAG: DMT family transporter [Candidatus Nealsonbacteria bacterium]|nr:DMT family transporter [Candidatus Nealsonbacteria bacterium]